MRRRFLLLSIIIALIATLACLFSACDLFSPEPTKEKVYTDWSANGDGTHSHSLVDDPNEIETEDCTYKITVVASTCKKAGYTLHVCEKCNYSYRSDETPVNPDNHTFVDHEGRLPTCTAEGWTAYQTCSQCTYTTYTSIPATGHDFGDWEYANTLQHTRVCRNCPVRGYGEHETEEDLYVAATCVNTGLTAGTHCTICAHAVISQEVIPIDENNHDDAAIGREDPTCTEEGKDLYRCTRCERTTSLPIAPLGHLLSEEIYAAADYHYNRCLRCETEQNKREHTPVTDPAVTPTCVDAGLSEGSHCSVCLYVIEAQTPIAASYSAHDLISHPALAPTCTTSGNYAYTTCSRCTYTTYREIDPLGHDYRAGELIPSTCVSYAKQIYACSRCSAGYTQIIGNTYSDHVYDGSVCRNCLRDRLSDYREEFSTHGRNADDLIVISDTATLALFFDYLFSEWIVEDKYFIYSGATVANYEQTFRDAKQLITTNAWAYSCYYSYSLSDNNTINYFSISCAHSGEYAPERICSVTPETGEYTPATIAQLDFLTLHGSGETRGETFDAFPYLSRSHTMQVTTSDQLFYAFSHGYRPLPTVGSAAEHVLEKAKTVAREIITEDMDDAMKIYAILQWIVRDVTYDYAAYDAAEADSLRSWMCTSWYAEGVFDYHLSVCDGIAKSVCILAGLENILCIRVVNETHAWNRVLIDVGNGEKQWFVLDATHSNVAWEDYEYCSLDQYLITDAQKTSYLYTAINYPGTAAAVTSIDPFALLHYDDAVASDSNDLVIVSDAELSDLIDCVLTERQGSESDYFSFSFFLPRSYSFNSTSAKLKVQQLFTLKGYTGTLLFLTNDVTYGGTSGYNMTVLIGD